MNDLIRLLTQPKVQEFIVSNEQVDVQKLLLRYKTILDVPAAAVAQQILARRKAKEKLPSWYRQAGIVYPPAVNLEQCSSESTARFKQGLVHDGHGADITGGFGVDTFHLSKVCTLMEYVEHDKSLAAITEHNLTLLGAGKVSYHRGSSEEFLHRQKDDLDLVYVDPSRRKQNKKVISLRSSEPDVIATQEFMLKKSRRVLIKASPMQDLTQAYRDLGDVEQFIVLSVENECRELLIERRRSVTGAPTIHAVNLEKDGQETSFAFGWDEEKNAKSKYSQPLHYLYEPNAAVLKAGAFKLVGERIGVYKLAPDTHLYTSDEMVAEFPGRIFRVIELVSIDKKLKGRFKEGYANVLVRNFPMSVEEIKRKTGISEGGQEYLVCTRTEKPLALVAERIR